MPVLVWNPPILDNQAQALVLNWSRSRRLAHGGRPPHGRRAASTNSSTTNSSNTSVLRAGIGGLLFYASSFSFVQGCAVAPFYASPVDGSCLPCPHGAQCIGGPDVFAIPGS
jgi:hypothetical protein